MMDVLKLIWHQAISEGGVVQRAPLIFTGAVLFLTALSVFGAWKVIDWRYNGIVENRDASITARDSHIGLLSAQIKDLERTIAQLKDSSAEVSKNPDSIYQLGSSVGTGIGAQSDLGNGRYYFRSIKANGDFNKDIYFKYRNLVLKVKSYGSHGKVQFAGEIVNQLHDVVCEIVQ